MARRRYGSRGNEGQQSREKKIIRRIFEMSIQQGYSPSRIAVTLNEEKVLALTEGVPWSEQQITRILEQHPKLLKKITEEHEKQQRQSTWYYLPGRSYWSEEEGQWIHEVEEVPVTKAEYDAEMDRVAYVTHQASEATRLEYFAKPFHFADPADPIGEAVTARSLLQDEEIEAGQDIGKLGLAGHDTWDKGPICDLVREQTVNTGKDAHELLSRIEGNASVKGPLRRAVWGLLREIALQRQANLSLRQQLRPTTVAPVQEPLAWPRWAGVTPEQMMEEEGLVTEEMIEEAREEDKLRSDACTTPQIGSDSPQHSP